jgi:hypothetical protein
MKLSLSVSMFHIIWNFLQGPRKATIDLSTVCVPAEVEAVRLPTRIQKRYCLRELARLSVLTVHQF